jgi:hypothetical protein
MAWRGLERSDPEVGDDEHDLTGQLETGAACGRENRTR